MKKNYLNSLNKWLIHHVLAMFILSIIIISFFSFYAIKLNVESNMEDMLPEDNLVLKQTEVFNSLFPSNETAIVVIEGQSSKIINFLEAFETELKGKSFVSSSLFYFDFSSLGKNAILFKDNDFYNKLDDYLTKSDFIGLNAFLTDLNSQPTLSKQYFKSDDNSTYLAFIKPLLGADFQSSRDSFYKGITLSIENAKSASHTSSLEVGLTGGAFIQDIEADTVAFEGLFSTFIFTLILILLFLLFSFKRILLPISMSIPLIGGAIISAGVAYLIYGHLNMFSISFAILLLGLGIDFGVHILSRYLEEKKVHNQKDALLIALNSTGSSIIIGGLTTSLSFMAFIIGQFKAFEQMGIISGIGILILCLTMFTMIPGLILFFDREKTSTSKQKTSRFHINSFLKPFLTYFTKKYYIIPLFTLILLLLLIPSVSKTTIIGDVNKIYPDDLPSILLAQKIEDTFGYSTNTISVYATDTESLTSITSELEASSLVNDTSSILDFIPNNQDEKLTILNKLSQITPDTYYNSVQIDDLDKKLTANYIGKNNTFLIEIKPTKDIYIPENYKEIENLIYKTTSMYPVGMPVIMNELISLVKSDIVIISMFCLLIILVLLLFIYRNWIDAIMTLTPLVISLYTTIGMMNLFKIDINIFSIAAFPLIIGIGIDSSIHLMHRLKENPVLINIEQLTNTGHAIFITSTTTIIGFSSLAMINHPGMANLGLAVSIGMLICLTNTLLLLPSLYQLKLSLHSKFQVLRPKGSSQ